MKLLVLWAALTALVACGKVVNATPANPDPQFGLQWAAFGILDDDQARVGQFVIGRIHDAQRHDIVAMHQS